MLRTSQSSESNGSDFWSASDHTVETSGSFKSGSSSAALLSMDQPELDLLASEILSISDGDCASDATPTFSDKSEATQAAISVSGPQDTSKAEDIAKQLDFGSVTTVIQLGNQQESPHQADAAATCDKNLTQDLETCVRPLPEDAATASQSQFALYCEESDSDSSNSNSSSHQVLQSTAASARPSSRRRAALDSDSDSDQVSTQCQDGGTQRVPSTSVYSFDVSDSDGASDVDSPQAGPTVQHKQAASGRNVIVLASSEEEDDVASCRQNSDHLCSLDSDVESSTSHKENLSPNQLATRLQSLHIRPPHTAVKPTQPPIRGAHRPRVPQTLPPKAKHTLMPSPSPSAGKTQSIASFKREREGLAYQLFRELNSAVFDGRLPADLHISWNVHLKTTAGLTHYSKTSLAGQAPKYTARVELSTKVIDSADKLQRTLTHELCHVATWLLDHVAKPPHGPHFKAWAAAAMRVHPHLDITTCHHYDIHFAWRWQCTNPECLFWLLGMLLLASTFSCSSSANPIQWPANVWLKHLHGNISGFEQVLRLTRALRTSTHRCLQIYKRHSNSIDITKQVCSSCRGQIQALGRFNQDGTPAKVRPPSRYSLFVKENFASHKKKCAPGTPHKEIMQALSCSWKARAGASDLAEVAESAAVL